ncbi:RtcB family protein, partial [Salmonella enterica]|uniref:RtcB family protein n=1 Tax=Salmonella enterica TaxID=28901 RepID=UPI000AD74CC6
NGCAKKAVQRSITSAALAEKPAEVRSALAPAEPQGVTTAEEHREVGEWEHRYANGDEKWAQLEAGYQWLTQKYTRFLNTNNYKHLGTLGTGNHIIEILLDETDRLWIMPHSASRGIGNAIGTYFIGLQPNRMQEPFE